MLILKAKIDAHENSTLNVDRDAQRKQQIGSGERSERIRTYNYPQDRITDHRLTKNFFGIDKMLEGELLQEIHEELSVTQENLAISSLEE